MPRIIRPKVADQILTPQQKDGIDFSRHPFSRRNPAISQEDLAGSVVDTGKINFTYTPEVILDQTGETGTDVQITTEYLAMKFVAPVDLPVSATATSYFIVHLKMTGSVTNRRHNLKVHIYNDNSGQPGTKRSPSENDNNRIYFAEPFSIHWEFPAVIITTTLVAGTTYWLVFRMDKSPSGGNLYFEGTTGASGEVFTSVDAVTWTPTTDKLWLKMLGGVDQPIYAQADTPGGQAVGIYSQYCTDGALKVSNYTGYGMRLDTTRGISMGCTSQVGDASFFASYAARALYLMTMNSTPAQIERTLDDGVLVDFSRALSVVGNITVASGVVSYNGFIGSHYFQLKPAQSEGDFSMGKVLVSTGELIPCEAGSSIPEEVQAELDAKSISVTPLLPADKQYFPYVDFTTTPSDKRVYGVFLGKLCSTADKGTFGENAKPIYQVASIGLAKVRVTDTNGNIDVGDYLETSSRSGEAQKQTSAQQLNSTLGKAMEPCDFSGVSVDPVLGYKWKLISCALSCG